MKKILLIIRHADFNHDTVEKIHFIYALSSDSINTYEILLLDEAVLLLNKLQTEIPDFIYSFAKKLQAAVMFDVQNIYALKTDLVQFKMKNIIFVKKLTSFKGFIDNYDLVMKL